MLKFIRTLITSITIATLLIACGGGGSKTDDESSSSQSSGIASIPNSNSNNSQPSIEGSPLTLIYSDQTYTFTPITQDQDNDSLTFSITNKPAWATFNESTGSLIGAPNTGNIGNTGNIIISVTDNITDPVFLPIFSITILASVPGNSPPSINGTPATTININQGYSFIPTAYDPNDDALTFSISNKPLWASFNTSTGSLTGTPGSTDTGTTSNIVISVNDGLASTSLPTFSLTVTNIPSIPTITGTPAASLYENTSYSFTPTAMDSNGDLLTFSITNKPSWAAFNTSTGALTGTPQNPDIGTTANITISVTDGFSGSVFLPGFSITVESTTANLSWVPPTTRVDSSPLLLSEIKGYKVYTGTNPDDLTLLIDINDSSVTEYIDTGLPPSTHYYAVTTYTQSNEESTFSTVASKTINYLF